MKLPDAPIIEKVRQWLAYADEDLRVARHGFSMPETPPCRVIAFHAQQCAEKCMKAYLVFHGVDFPFTHSLRRLLDLSASPAAWAEQLRDAEELSPYAITARDPLLMRLLLRSALRSSAPLPKQVVRPPLVGGRGF